MLHTRTITPIYSPSLPLPPSQFLLHAPKHASSFSPSTILSVMDTQVSSSSVTPKSHPPSASSSLPTSINTIPLPLPPSCATSSPPASTIDAQSISGVAPCPLDQASAPTSFALPLYTAPAPSSTCGSDSTPVTIIMPSPCISPIILSPALPHCTTCCMAQSDPPSFLLFPCFTTTFLILCEYSVTFPWILPRFLLILFPDHPG